jgi:hypothetical protein
MEAMVYLFYIAFFAFCWYIGYAVVCWCKNQIRDCTKDNDNDNK